MRSRTITAILSAGAVLLLAPAPALAKPPSGPDGTIDLMNSVPEATLSTSSGESVEPTTPELAYFGVAEFHTTITGKVSSKADLYVTVVCMQDENLVYLYSKHTDTDDYLSFPLEDQPGQGVEWYGGDASCEALLIYRVHKGKSTERTVLETERFEVTGTDTTVFV
jgi:hypothetical protein